MTDTAALVDAVRDASTRQAWSRGTQLARSGAVVPDRGAAGERTFRVVTRGGLDCPRVRIFPEESGWDCNCDSAAEACEHVVAAALALQDEATGATPPVVASTRGRVAYALAHGPGGLALQRLAVIAGATAVPIEAPLAAITSGRADGPALVATPEDLAVEAALGTYRRGPLPRALVLRVLGALAKCPSIELDGVPVRAAAEPLRPHVAVTDAGDGFRVALEAPDGVTAVFGNGIALRAGVLHATADVPLTAREREDLERGVVVAAGDVADLVGTLLPQLRSKLDVRVRTARLPQALLSETPRALVRTELTGEDLLVTAEIVYGDPVRARVVDGRLIAVAGAVPVRDTAAEQRVARELRAALGLEPGVAQRCAPEDALARVAELARWGGSVEGSAQQRFVLSAPLQPEWTLDPAHFDVTFAVEHGGASRRVSGASVIEAFERGAAVVALPDGGFAPLPQAWLAAHAALVADLLAARGADGALAKSAYPALRDLADALDVAPPVAVERFARALECAAQSTPQLPLDLAADLRPYQREGVAWLAARRDAGVGALLADDMGLGKTLQALCAVSGRTLVIAPTSVLHAWRAQAAQFRPGLNVAVHHGPGRRLDPGADVTLTSYALLRLDSAALAGEVWDTVVLDEAQNIRNPESQVAEAAFRLRAHWRLALTGTPIENRLLDIWSIFRFLEPGLLGDRRAFGARYAEAVAGGDAVTAAQLAQRLAPFALRRLKRDVAPELPPRTETTLLCTLSQAERDVYDAVRVAARSEVVERLGGGETPLAVLTALLRLRQAACHSALVPGAGPVESSAKLDVLIDALDTCVADGHKSLVFSQWTSLLTYVEGRLKQAGIGFTRLDGATRDRGAVVDAFQDGAGPPVMLISLKAGGTGLTLTAADHVFLLDPWWNPATEDQAADRAHRIGQDKPVFITRLVAEDTVEDRILALAAHKRTLAGAALGAAAGTAALTRGELLALLD